MKRQPSLFPGTAGLSLRDVAEAVRVAGLDGLPDAKRRADEARYQEIDVRSAMVRTKGMPFHWALNPYRGCTHACEYCYARKYQRHLELGAGDDFSSVILVKTNLPEKLHREVTRPSWTRESIAIGTATDPYQPIEGHYRITRRCLEVLVAARTPFSIVTKGPMVVRDRDVIAAAGAECRVYLSVPSIDDEACRRLEPGTAPPAQRLRAACQLVDAGIDARVLMMPLVPGITTSRRMIERTIEAIASAGLRLAGANVARLDQGVREHFLGFLSREFPALVDGYHRLYVRSRADSGYAAGIRDLVNSVARQAGVRRSDHDLRGSTDEEPSAPESAARSAGANRTA